MHTQQSPAEGHALSLFLRKCSKHVPVPFKRYFRQRMDIMGYMSAAWEKDDPFSQDPPTWEVEGSPYRVGIIREFSHRHSFYVAACRELNLSYRILDIADPKWVTMFRESGCDFFLVWPSTYLGIWKEMFDERLWVLAKQMHQLVCPTFEESFIYENKRRVHDWLDVNRIPHPETWVFFERATALAFAKQCPLPIVVKSTRGACASGVRIIRARRDALKITEQYFSHGVVPDRGYKWDAQRLCIIFQEYLPNVDEWRMVRVGDSYFGYRKEKTGDFHSGSHGWSWLDPGKALLDTLHDVTERGGFTSMNIDIFRTADGQLLVNELQTVFGATNPADMLVIDGKPGRYRHEGGAWIFEAGDFCRNHLANLRLEYVVKKAKQRAP